MSSLTLEYEDGSVADIVSQVLQHIGYIKSTPTTGQFLITDIRLDSSKRWVIKYDEEAQ